MLNSIRCNDSTSILKNTAKKDMMVTITKMRQTKIRDHDNFESLRMQLDKLKYNQRYLLTKNELAKKIVTKGISTRSNLEQLNLILKSKNVAQKHQTNSSFSALALDCEMVGSGNKGQCQELARVTIVNYSGKIVLDTFVKSENEITDYRYQITGIKKKDLINAPSKKQISDKVQSLIKNKILVGHGLDNDLECLNLTHSPDLLRDTLKDINLLKLNNNINTSLKQLLFSFYNIVIQQSVHSSIEDALSSMIIYRKLQHLDPILLSTLTSNILKDK
ncbi:hypothetical protein K502DRAFT_333579 [Neoconidiobolus thromboides FSU 785]|nr:hypothetical protein K502DRAFT_333579 [Neoconidiobolus thromboides FSU 785]